MVMGKPFRIEPRLPAAAYKSYVALQPRASHTRPATCQEVDCPNYERGWKTIVDVSTPLGREQASYIRLHSGRHFTFAENGTLVTFIFPAGQQCFTQHRVLIGYDPICKIKGGDHRGNPLGIPTRNLPLRSWLDDFGEHQEKLADATKKG